MDLVPRSECDVACVRCLKNEGDLDRFCDALRFDPPIPASDDVIMSVASKE